MLHTINKSPFQYNNLNKCIRIAQAGDPILFIEDGVYAAQDNTNLKSTVQEILKKHPVYVLEPDLNARGVGALIEGVQKVDYDGFVDLAEQHNVVPWL